MHPNARRDGLVARQIDNDLLILGTKHDVHRLDPVAAWLWQHADGTVSIDGLLMGLRAALHADADRDLVFEAPDRLADAGLLQARVAPPSGVSRRVLLERLAGASALGALLAVVGRPMDALAKGGKDDSAGGQCGDEKEIIAEIAYLEAQESAVAKVLDGWVNDAEKQEDADTYYIDALDARERTRKKSAAALTNELDDATSDLDACTTQRFAAKEKTHKHRLQQRLKLRQEKSIKHRKRHLIRQESSNKRTLKQEKSRKKKIGLHAERFKKQAKHSSGKPAVDFDLAIIASRAREKWRKGHSEKRAKYMHVRSDAHLEQHVKHAETGSKQTKTQLLSKERHSKIRAAAYTERQQEHAFKSVNTKGSPDDYILEIAQQEALLAAKEAAVAREQAYKAEEKEKAQEQETKRAELAKEKSYKGLAALEKDYEEVGAESADVEGEEDVEE